MSKAAAWDKTKDEFDAGASDEAAVPASPTQSLDRALHLLDAVVAQGTAGIALGPLAESAGLSKPTAHRLLSGLRNAGLIDYDAASRQFHPAFKLYQMGQAAGARFSVIQIAAPSLARLAEATGDTVYLSIRSGDFLSCVAREVGDFPIKMLTLSVGDIRPLGLGSNGLVLLAALSEAECERIMLKHHEALSAYAAFDEQSLRHHLERTRECGYGFNQGLMLPEMSAIAMGIRDPSGAVNASISVASITSRLTTPRRDALLGLLRREIETIENLMVAYQQVGAADRR